MIEIKKCSKSFGSVKAVDKVSLEIGEREVFGLVGLSLIHISGRGIRKEITAVSDVHWIEWINEWI